MENKFPVPAGFEHYDEDLIKRFPYQFDGCRLGASVPAGWAAVFSKLCEDVDALLGENKRGFRWDQVKEKWGSMRAYFLLGKHDPDMRLDIMSEAPGGGAASLIVKPKAEGSRPKDVQELMHKLRSVILEAEQQTQKLCAVCAKPCEIAMHGGLVMALCEEHSAKYVDGGCDADALGNFWISLHPGSWDDFGALLLLPKGVKVKSSKQPMPKSAAIRAAEQAAHAYADDLVQRFPYQFSGPSIRIAEGWKGIFAKLCATVDELLGQDKRGFHWTQAGEQFGAASLHFELGSDVPADVVSELSGKLRAAIAEVENQTGQMCIVCGRRGELDKSQPWVLALCKQHAAGGRNRLLWVGIPKGLP